MSVSWLKTMMKDDDDGDRCLTQPTLAISFRTRLGRGLSGIQVSYQLAVSCLPAPLRVLRKSFSCRILVWAMNNAFDFNHLISARLRDMMLNICALALLGPCITGMSAIVREDQS